MSATREDVRAVLKCARKVEIITPELKILLEQHKLLDAEVTELIHDQLDYILIYVNKDSEDAKEIHEKLKTTKCTGSLLNLCSNDSVDDIKEKGNRATLKLLIVSNNLGGVSNKIKKNVSQLIMHDLQTGDKCIVPVWMVDKNNIDLSDFNPSLYLSKIVGLDPKSPSFEVEVQSIVHASKAKKYERMRRQHENLVQYLQYRIDDMRKNIPTRVSFSLFTIQCYYLSHAIILTLSTLKYMLLLCINNLYSMLLYVHPPPPCGNIYCFSLRPFVLPGPSVCNTNLVRAKSPKTLHVEKY